MFEANKRIVGVLSLAHFVNDSYASIVYPLLPLLAGTLHLTELEVFFLVPVFAITSALLQPVYGFVADRYSRRMLAVLGPGITGCFVSLVGIAPSYGVLLTCLFIGGVGAGAFHPQAVSLAANASGKRRRLGVSIFTAAGTLGFALGPLMIALVVGTSGLRKTSYAFWLGLVVSVLLYFYCPVGPERTVPRGGFRSGLGLMGRALKPVWRPLFILTLISLSRAATLMLMNNYLPFILKEEGYSLKAIGGVLTAFLLVGAMGAFAGGAITEWVGERPVIIISGAMTTVLLGAAFLLHGPLSTGLMAAGAFTLMSIIPANIAWAQELVPRETSTASALLMGFAWGLGSLSAPLAEPLTSIYGFRPVLVVAALFPFLVGLLSFLLPDAGQSPVGRTDRVVLAASVPGD